jgi:hypothetical protein
MIASLQQRIVSPSLVLHRLGSYAQAPQPFRHLLLRPELRSGEVLNRCGVYQVKFLNGGFRLDVVSTRKPKKMETNDYIALHPKDGGSAPQCGQLTAGVLALTRGEVTLHLEIGIMATLRGIAQTSHTGSLREMAVSLGMVAPISLLNLIKQFGLTYIYNITGVPDFDQRWNFLPNNGAMYCVPTAAMNWIHYLTKHGWPGAEAFPVKNAQDVTMINMNLTLMAGYMQTDPIEGTGGDNAFEGLVDYLDDRSVPALVTTDSASDCGHITLDDLEGVALFRGLAIVGQGRYQQISDAFFRTGGHAMSLVGLGRSRLEADVEVSDPADDAANLNTQSASIRTPAHLKQEVRKINGETVTVLRWGTGTSPFCFIDNWMAIVPLFALTNPTDKVILAHVSIFETGGTETKEFRFPFEGELVDLAIHPSVPSASMIVRGSGDIWMLDLARASWSKTAAVPSAQFLTYGGRDRRLFVVRGTQILSFDGTGKALDKLEIGGAIDAISYDQKNDRLIVAMPSTKRLLAVTPALQDLDNTETPEVPGTGRLTLSVNGRDATIVLSREGSPDLATLRWHSTGARAQGRFRLMTEGRTSAAHVDRKGRLSAVEDGKIATFDTDGNRLVGALFDGLPAGPLLKIARSSHNFDPVRSRLKEWKNGAVPSAGVSSEARAQGGLGGSLPAHPIGSGSPENW